MKWHILKEDKANQERPSAERTTRLLYQPSQFALIAEHGTFIIPFAANVDITEAKWRLRKPQPYKTNRYVDVDKLKERGVSLYILS